MVQIKARKPDYSDLDLDFIRHPGTSDVAKKVGDEAIKRSIRNLVLTNFYERPFRSYIGSNATKLLFENFSPMISNFLKNAISEVITNFEPRVTLENVDIIINEEENAYEATVQFRINNRLDSTISTFFLRRIR